MHTRPSVRTGGFFCVGKRCLSVSASGAALCRFFCVGKRCILASQRSVSTRKEGHALAA